MINGTFIQGFAFGRRPGSSIIPILRRFDFAVIRFNWQSINGRDLDTRTGIINSGTQYDNVMAGWCKQGTIGENYIIWGGDNTGTAGPESHLVDFNKISTNFPSLTDITIQTRAFWYSQRADGNVTLQIQTYLGGTMSPSGRDFVNIGGTLVDNIQTVVNVAPRGDGNCPDGYCMKHLVYNVQTQTATLVDCMEKVIIVGQSGEMLYSDTPVSSFSQAIGGYIAGSAGNLYSAGYGAGKYIIGGSYGEIFTATTLPDFTKSVIPVMFTNNQTIEGMVYGNGIWVAVGGDPSRIATSLDGVTWTTRTSAVSSSAFGALIFANGCFLCTAGNGKMMRSVDGINWSLVTTGFSTDSFFNTIPALVWTGQYFVAASSDDGYAVKSVDGITWTTMNIGTGSAGFYYHAAHGDGKVTILLGNNGYYRYSSDLVTWTLAQIPGLSGGTNTICYDGQKYIVTSGGGGTIRQSIDGIVWTTPSMGIDPITAYARAYRLGTTTISEPFLSPILSWRMDEASGSVIDYSGNGYTGRVDGTPTRNATVYGGNKGMQLTASGHGVSIDKGACPLAVAALESQTCTISMVFENTSSGAANPCPFIIWNSASGGFSTLRLGNITPAYVNWSSSAGSQNYGNIGDGTVTGLKIITYVKTPSEGRLYVDGVLVATKVHSPSVFPATSSSDRIQVGGHLNFPESYQYTGRVSDLNIWNVALTSEEVFALANRKGRTDDQRTNIDPYAANVESIVDFNSITEFYPIISQSSQGNFTSPITINSADDFCMEAFIDRSQGSSSVFSMHDNAYQTLSFFDMRGGSRILGVEMHSQFDNIVLNTTKDMVHIALFKSAGVCYLTIDGVVRNSVPYTGGNRVISSGFFSTNGTDGIRKFRVCVGYTPYTGAFTPTDYLDDLPAASGIVSYLDCEDYNLDGTYLAPQEQSISRVWSGSQSMGFFSDHAGNKFKAPSNLAYHPTIKQGVVISNSSLSGKVLRIDNPTNVINILTHNMKSYDRPPFVHASRIATLEAMIEFDNPDITGTQDLSQGSDFSVAFMKFMTNNNFSRGLIIVHADHNAAADVTIKIQAGSNFYTVPQTIPYNTKAHVALQYDMGSVFFCINGTRHLIATYNPSVTDYIKIEYKHFIINGGKSNYLRMTNGVARYGATYTVPSTPYPNP